MSKAAAIGIDIGGTQIKAVAVHSEGIVLDRRQADTADRAEALLERLNDLLRQLTSSEALGISMPGLVPPGSDHVAWMRGRLEYVEGLDWSRQLDRPVYLLNDALAAMAGEARVGAARHVRDAILMTLGTGVGGAIVVDGHVLRGRLGRAGHLGHMTVDALGPRDIVRTPGSLEGAIGNHTVKARSFGRFESTWHLVEAHLQGDPEATRVWLDSIWYLAAAIASLVNITDPQRVLVGGGICKAGDALFKPLAAYLRELEWRPIGQPVEIPPSLSPQDYHDSHMKTTKIPTQDYLDKCAGLIERIRGQADAIQHVADRFAQTILTGRMVHLFGSGHSRIMVEEMWPRYGSFPGFNPMVELSLSFHHSVVGSNGQRQAMFLENVSGFAERILRNYDLEEIDSALVVSSSGCNVVPIEIAEGFKQRGIFVAAIVSQVHSDASTSKRADGKKLGDFADVVLDTGAPVGDAMVKLDGLEQSVAPGSTIGGCLLVNCIKAEVAKRLIEAGQPPKALASGAILGNERAAQVFEAAYDEHAHRLAKLFADVGKNQ